MIAFVIFLSSLLLLGAAVALKLSRRAVDPPVTAAISRPHEPGQGLLPDGGEADGLAAFYAYQIAAGRVERPL